MVWVSIENIFFHCCCSIATQKVGKKKHSITYSKIDRITFDFLSFFSFKYFFFHFLPIFIVKRFYCCGLCSNISMYIFLLENIDILINYFSVLPPTKQKCYTFSNDWVTLHCTYPKKI